MPIRSDHTSWSEAEKRRVAVLASKGVGSPACADILNKEFHKGKLVRTPEAVRLIRTKIGIYVTKSAIVPPTIQQPQTEQEVEHKATESGIEAKAHGKRIKTVEDLLRHIGADMSKYEVDKSEATKYEVATKDPATGKVTTTELHRVFVRLKQRAGPGIIEVVEAMIAGAIGKRLPVVASKSVRPASEIMQALIIADPHIGKYAWSHETGWEDYDVSIATALLRSSAAELLADGNARRVGRRVCGSIAGHCHRHHSRDRKSTRLNSSHVSESRMPSSA
mgnify:CR=1 FL=1